MDTIFGVIMPDGSKHEIGDKYVRGLLNGSGEGEEKNEGGSSVLVGAADYVTPQMYGAVGDGETDDYEAFAKMFAAEPAYVYIPAGTYYISSCVTILPLTRTVRGAGIGSTTIICGNGFISTGTTVMYYTAIEDMTLKGADDAQEGTAIEGKFVECSFANVRMWYFEKGFNFNGNTWINRFNNIDVAYAQYAIYTEFDAFNNNVFRGCNFQYCEFVFYTNQQTQSLVFDGCDIERNEAVFSMHDGLDFVVRGCHIENNTGFVIKLNGSCYGADFTFENCFIYGSADESGWFAVLPTMNAVSDIPSSVLNINSCYIRTSSEDQLKKMIAFDATAQQYSNIAVCIRACRFYYKPETYFDLFDTTNCSHYGDAYNRLPIDTDLIYHKEGDLRWYCKTGNTYDKMRQDTLFEVIGTYPGYAEASNTKFAISMNGRVGKVSGEALLGGAIFIDNGADGILTALLSDTSPGGLIFSMPSAHSFTTETVAYVHIKY